MDKAIADLWQKYRRFKEEEVKSELVMYYLWMVKYIAGRLPVRLPPSMGVEDLESCGILGLLESVEKYDPELGRDFEAYSYHRIRGSMLDEIRKVSWVPRSMWQKMQELKSVRERLERERAGEITEELLSREMGLPVAEIRRLDAHYSNAFAVSLDENCKAGEDEVRFGDMIQDISSLDPLEQLSEEDGKRTLAEAVKMLTEKEQILLSLYYHEELTLKEIGKVLEVSESRVCQLHGRAIGRLRKILDQMNK
ncbi:RNA polymerase sigma factor for flagellar operon [Desulfocucumis palustris]|uniref:RNA polymerase sigma factor for flagellar operon n=1 Tax=Desulfocucumis palustris TaxID=1898651 RepID=A0A2L2XAB2_9FIRM|nr:FliA/WhiG family RNA polymerase sigma factor [Desulfocucumis palustris]GBF33207.1 RNA polymerase sigma factor for flagellar operon [Desulfocucumis palustris]